MKRFVVVNTGGLKPICEVQELLAKQPGVLVLDGSSKSLLVSGDKALIEAVLFDIDGWVVTPERFQPLPRTRPTIKKQRQN